MGNISESIFSNSDYVIPMAEVSFIRKTGKNIIINFKHGTWNEKCQQFDPCVVLRGKKAIKFLSAWSYYRHELEADTLKPEPEND